MTIVLKEAARRRITRRRKVESNGKAREYSQAPKSATPNAEFLARVADLRARELATDPRAFDGISGAELVNAGRATREYSQRGDL